MVWFDYVLFGLIVIAVVVGLILGFAHEDDSVYWDGEVKLYKRLNIFSRERLWLKIIAFIFITYVIFHIMIKTELFFGVSLIQFREMLNSGSGFVKILGDIRMDIVWGVLMSMSYAYLFITIVRGTVSLLVSIFSKEVAVIINRVLGAVYAIFLLVCILLIFMQFYRIIGGVTTATENIFVGSGLKLDYIFTNNPLNNIFML